MLSQLSTAASAYSSACRSRAWTRSQSKKRSITSDTNEIVLESSRNSGVCRHGIARRGGSRGPGIMGERLAGGNVAIALLANTIATGAALVALICAFGDISGAHLNPVVSLAEALNGRLSRGARLSAMRARRFPAEFLARSRRTRCFSSR